MTEIKHGTLHAYAYYKCRCDDCRKNWNSYCLELKRIRRAEFQAQQASKTE